MHALLPEFRIGGTMREEVLEGFSKLDDRQLRGTLRHLEHPGEAFLFDLVQLFAEGKLGRLWKRVVFAPCPVLDAPLFKSPVICEPCDTSRTQHVRPLMIVEVKGYLVGHQHRALSSTAFLTSSRSFLFLWDRLP